MNDVIELRELRVQAVVGVLSEERDRAQRAEHEEVRDALVSHDRKLMRRLTVFGIILALLTLLVEARHEIVTGELKIPNIFTLNQPILAYEKDHPNSAGSNDLDPLAQHAPVDTIFNPQ